MADQANHRIRKITSAGVVSTLAGGTTETECGTTTMAAIISGDPCKDGTGADARFINPVGVAVDSGGNVYVAEIHTNRIRKITPAGVVTTLAGGPSSGRQSTSISFIDGSVENARFDRPRGVAVDSNGIVYVADTNNDRIRKIRIETQ